MIFIYLAIINIVTFVVFAVDKRKAVKHQYRVPEKVLLGLSFVGGAAGGLLSMHILRHKTKKLKFTISLPLMLIIQIAVLVFFMLY